MRALVAVMQERGGGDAPGSARAGAGARGRVARGGVLQLERMTRSDGGDGKISPSLMEAEELAEASEEDGEDDDAEEGAWLAARDALAGILGGTETLAAAAARTALETLAPVMRREGWEAAPWEARRACMVVAKCVAESSRAAEAVRGAPWRALVWNATVAGLRTKDLRGGRTVAAWALRAADALLGARPPIAPPPAQQIALAAALVPALSCAAAAAAPLAVVRACKVPVTPSFPALSLPLSAAAHAAGAWQALERLALSLSPEDVHRALLPRLLPPLLAALAPPLAPASPPRPACSTGRGAAARRRMALEAALGLLESLARAAPPPGAWAAPPPGGGAAPPAAPWAPGAMLAEAMRAAGLVACAAPRPPAPSPTRLAPVLAPLERRR